VLGLLPKDLQGSRLANHAVKMGGGGWPPGGGGGGKWKELLAGLSFTCGWMRLKLCPGDRGRGMYQGVAGVAGPFRVSKA